MADDITKRLDKLIINRLDKLERELLSMRKEAAARERNWLRTGITVLGFLVVTLFGVIWSYRSVIFGSPYCFRRSMVIRRNFGLIMPSSLCFLDYLALWPV